jgi:hypothetical protein
MLARSTASCAARAWLEPLVGGEVPHRHEHQRKERSLPTQAKRRSGENDRSSQHHQDREPPRDFRPPRQRERQSEQQAQRFLLERQSHDDAADDPENGNGNADAARPVRRPSGSDMVLCRGAQSRTAASLRHRIFGRPRTFSQDAFQDAAAWPRGQLATSRDSSRGTKVFRSSLDPKRDPANRFLAGAPGALRRVPAPA